MHHCGFCGKKFPITSGVKKHLAKLGTACALKFEASLLRLSAVNVSTDEVEDEPDVNEPSAAVELDAMDIDVAVPESEPAPETAAPEDPPRQSARPTVEDVEDEGDAPSSTYPGIERFIEDFPEPAAAILGVRETVFEKWKREERETGRSMYHPFEDEEDWEMAEMMQKQMGQNAIDAFLKLGKVRSHAMSALAAQYNRVCFLRPDADRRRREWQTEVPMLVP
jgi:hypothetical protein